MFNFCNVARIAMLAAAAMLSAPTWASLMTCNFQIDVANGNPVADLFVFSSTSRQDNVSALADIIAPSGAQSLNRSFC